MRASSARSHQRWGSSTYDAIAMASFLSLLLNAVGRREYRVRGLLSPRCRGKTISRSLCLRGAPLSPSGVGYLNHRLRRVIVAAGMYLRSLEVKLPNRTHTLPL